MVNLARLADQKFPSTSDANLGTVTRANKPSSSLLVRPLTSIGRSDGVLSRPDGTSMRVRGGSEDSVCATMG